MKRPTVFRAAQLIETGMTRQQIRDAVAVGNLVKVRHGWFALPRADEQELRAVKAGGVLACLSALRWYGVWTLGNDLHVRYTGHGTRIGGDGCKTPGRPPATPLSVDSLHNSLAAAARCVGQEELIVLVDSLRNLGLMKDWQIREALRQSSARGLELFRMSDLAESGTETLVRLRLRAARIRVRPQVVIPGVGRVDLLVGRSLVIEVDSKAHHTSMSNYESDRARDRRLVAMGYTVMRLSYAQVLFDWDSVLDDILVLIRRRQHHRSPKSQR